MMTIKKISICLVIAAFAVAQGVASAQDLTKAQQKELDRRQEEEQAQRDRAVASSIEGQFNTLLSEKAFVEEKIAAVQLEQQGASKSKTRRLDKDLQELNEELDVINRKISTFPRSLRDPEYVADDSKEKAAFLAELQQEIDARIAAQNHAIESQRAAAQEAEQGNITYRVMIAISQSPLSASDFVGLKDIIEQRMSDGSIVYYQGAYSTQEQAQRACRAILAQQTFRDAFVVAMDGYTRVEMP